MAVTPSGTAVGCASTVSIVGGDFTAVGVSAADVNVFGDAAPAAALSVSATMIECASPTPDRARSIELRLGFAGFGVLTVTTTSMARFDYYTETTAIAAASPRAGAYNLEASLVLDGSFLNYGGVRCRFGGLGATTAVDGSWSSSALACTLARRGCGASSRRFPIRCVTSSGRCRSRLRPTASAFPRPARPLRPTTRCYRPPSLRGAPSTASVSITIVGEGFVWPGLAEALCGFESGGGALVTTTFTTLSPTTGSCASPATGTAVTWDVSVMLNGLKAEPTLYGTPQFVEYDLDLVRVSALRPPGGAVGASTPITIKGSGFGDYGSVKCRVGGAVVDALLLDGESALCTVPPPVAVGSVGVTLSLNNGTDGTWSRDELPFTVYDQPEVVGVVPAEGDANGGTEVVVETRRRRGAVGRRRRACRVSAVQVWRGGAADAADLAQCHTHVACSTTWGRGGGPAGGLALNGLSFAAGTARFFKGLHKPALLEARFSPEGTTLVVVFDAQPTNRGGMTGVGPCAAVLGDATVALLACAAATRAALLWEDDSTLVAYLNYLTDAGPGMAVTVRPGVLWPKMWPWPRAPATSRCAPKRSPSTSTITFRATSATPPRLKGASCRRPTFRRPSRCRAARGRR